VRTPRSRAPRREAVTEVTERTADLRVGVVVVSRTGLDAAVFAEAEPTGLTRAVAFAGVDRAERGGREGEEESWVITD